MRSGPEEVVEIGDVVPDFGDVDRHVLGLGDQLVGGVAHLPHQARHLRHRVDRLLHLVGLNEHVGHPVLHVLLVELAERAPHAHLERNGGVLDRFSVGPGDRLDAGDPGHPEDGLGDLVDDEEVRGVAQVVVAFHHQQFGIHPRGAEVPVGDGVADVGGDVFGQVLARVVVGLVTRQRDQADERQRQRRGQHRAGPSHHRRPDAPPAAGPDRALGLEQAEAACRSRSPRARASAPPATATNVPDRARHAQGLEVRQAGEAQAQHRAGDGQPGAQHDVRGAAEHRVVRGFPVLARAPGLLISADREDGVVGARGDHHQGQQVHRERRQSDDLVGGQERDDAPGGAELDEHHEQDQEHRRDRPVDDQQHHRDDADRDERDPEDALVAGVVLVGDQRRRAGDVRLDPRRRRGGVDDLADRGDRLVGQRLALIAAQVHLHVGGLAVGALRTRRRQRVAPEVRDVLDVRGVGLELVDELVVVAVRLVAERLVALQHDHRGAVGVELLEVAPMRFIEIKAGASLALSPTVRSSPTFSSDGTATLVSDGQQQSSRARWAPRARE